MPQIVPNLWMDTEGEEAAAFYCSIFPNSRILNVVPYGADAPGKEGQTLLVEFELDGQRHTIINGGPQFTFSEAVSLLISCEDQAEVDRYWAALTDGGQEGPCGWCKDRYGLSWQVVPKAADALFADPDPARRERVMRVMYTMTRLDLAALQAAADAEGPVGVVHPIFGDPEEVGAR